MDIRMAVVSALAVVLATFDVAHAFTTATVPSDGVYKFAFGSGYKPDGYTHVETNAIYDAAHQYADTTPGSGTYTYGFLGTTENSYKTDIPWSLTTDARMIDGFYVVMGQYVQLREEAQGVAGPLKADYMPSEASDYEGRYPVRFSFSAEQEAYYAVTCTVVNVSATEEADVTLFSERCHIIAHHATLAASETRTFAWSVELFPNYSKGPKKYYQDDAINVVVVGKNAGLKELIAVKQPQTSGTIRGEATAKMNVGKTMWLCDDSTGTDQASTTPYFSLQNYSGVGSGLSRWAPANLSIRNQGEGGLATGAKEHRKSCMLKPGDYLYVEYGHNESSPTSYTNNLEVYLQDADAAQAKLLIVSPVERHTAWNKETQSWDRSLGSYAVAGETWVEDKIAQGARNVAFIDLNKCYNDWMNREIHRITNINQKVSLQGAIDFYYRSAKGANVDGTHINNAGTDQAAYWVWYDALQRVAAGENADPTSSAYIQAQVLKGITTGYQNTVGINGTETSVAWSVTDDIIAAGAAPNSFYDTPVTAGYDYVNDAAVASVDAVANADGSVTLSNVTMRILNPGNYYKAVVEVVNAAGTVTNTYYSYYNYDVGGAGKMSGDLVTPNESGFIDGDRDKDDVTAADRQTIEIPDGSTAQIWIAPCDTKWVVGTNEACSAKYPVKWWSQTMVDDDCVSGGWAVNSGAVWTTNVVDGALYFTSSGATSSGTKKPFGLGHNLDADVGSGCYRISFKAMVDAGEINYVLADSFYKTTTSTFNNYVNLLQITTSSVTGYQNTKPLVTLGGDDNKTPQAKINASSWVDVDLIVDRDNARAWLSVGGSDYVTWRDAAFLPGSYSGRTWQMFGVVTPAQVSSYGYIKDFKVLKLASVTYPTFTVKAVPSDSALGSVTINDYAVNTLALYSGSDVMLSATAANRNFYKFSGWTDAQSAVISTKANLFYPAQTADLDLTADFAAYGNDEDRVLTWDFSNYAGDFAISNQTTTVTNNGLNFVMTTGEALTTNGFKWANSANRDSTKTVKYDWLYYAKYITYTPTANGTLTLKATIDAVNSKRTASILINKGTSTADCTVSSALASVSLPSVGTEYTLSCNLNAGETYYIWPYCYNWSGAGYYHNISVSSITYTYPPLVTLTVPAVENASVKVLANGTVVTPATSTALTNTYTITMGSGVTVAYTSSRPGYIIQDGTITYPSMMTDQTVDTSAVTSVPAYTWTGLAGDGLWATPNNWNYAGAVPDDAPAYCADDLVGFSEDAVVDVGNTNVYDGANLYVFNDAEVELKSSTTGNMTLQNVNYPITLNATTPSNWAVLNKSYTVDSTLTLKGRWRFAKNGSLFAGDGRLVLKDCTLYGVGSSTSRQDNKINIPVEMSTGCAITMNIDSSSKGYCRFHFNSPVTGGGTVVITSGNQNSWSGATFSCGMSGFTGRVTWTTTKSNASIHFGTDATDMEASAWSLYYKSGVVTTGGDDPFSAVSGWYEFGALDLNMPEKTAQDLKLRIGALNEDSHLTGAFAAGNTRTIDWIAPTATLHTALLNVNTLSVTGGGTVNFAEPKTGVASTNGVPLTALTFADQGGYVVCQAETFAVVTNAIKNSTAPIGFMVAADETFELDPAVLDASNLKVFRKAGEGTLSVAANTLFTNLTDRIKRTITITDLPDGKRVAFEAVDGCEKAVVADAYADLKFDIDSGVTSNHVGTITGASNLVKRGAGTLVLIGNNSFEGAVRVDAGSLKLGDYGDMSGMLYDFDASQSDTLEYGEDGILKMYDSIDGKEYFETVTNLVTGAGNKYAYRGRCAMPTNDAAVFGGKTVIASDMFRMASSWSTYNDATTRSFILLGQYLESPLNYRLIEDWSDTFYGLRWRMECADGQSLRWNNNGTISYEGYRVNGVYNGTFDYADPFVFSTTNNLKRTGGYNSRKQCIGGECGFAFAEYLVYERKLSVEELEIVECSLKSKWGLADYTPIPTTADITVASGATLDLGSQTPTVMSVTFASGATVRFDALPDDGYILRTTAGHAADLTGVTFVLAGEDITDRFVCIQTEEGVHVARPIAVYDVAEGESQVVVGAFTPYLTSLTKNGAGTLTLVGDNTFEGAVSVNAGTLKIDAPYAHVGTQLARFDTTYADTIAYTDGTFSAISDLIHGTVSLKSSGDVIPEVGAYDGVLGGKTVLHSSYLKLLMSAKIAAHKTTFMVAKLTLGTGNHVITDNQNSKYGVIRRNSLDYYQWRAGDTYSPNDVYVNGVNPAHAASGEEFVMCVDTNAWKRYPNSAGAYHFGSGYEGYLGEVILYQEDLDATQRGVVEDYLMTKWSVGTASYNPIPVGADIAVAAGATLDLGEFQPTVATLALASGSTIAMDALPSDGVVLTANAITLGDNITIKVGGVVMRPYRLKVRDNGDGTYSLIAFVKRGVLIVFE